MRPPADHILPVCGGVAGFGLLHVPAVTVRLKGDCVAIGREPIQTEPTLAEAPGVGGVSAIGEQRVIAIEILSVEAKINIGRQFIAISCTGKIVEKSSPAR